MALGDLTASLSAAPEYQTDENIKRKRALAEQLMMQGGDTSPIRSPWQGVARLAQGIIGGLGAAQADTAEKENQKYNSDLLQGLLTPQNRAAAAPDAPSPAPGASTPHAMPNALEGVRNAIVSAAGRYGIPEHVALAMASQESSMNPNAPHGGLLQITQGTAANPGYGLKPVQYAALTDPATNADFGFHYLAAKSPNTDWNDPAQVNKALAAYNGGGDPNYVQNVRRFMPQEAALGGAAAPTASPSQNASSPTQSDKAQKILLAMADPRLSPGNKQILALMYQNATKEDQRFTSPHTDAQGNMIQEGPNGQVHVIAKNTAAADGVNHRHVIGGALVDDSGKVIYSAPEKKAGMSQDAIDLAAQRELAGDHSWVTGLGRGAQGAENITAVQERAAQMAKEGGMDAEAIKRNTAQFGGVKAAARSLETFNSKMVALTEKVDKAADYAKELSDKLPRGSFVPITQLMQMAQAANSNPQLKELNAAVNTLVNEYATATGGGGQGTDAQRLHAREMLNAADSPETFGRVINVMKREVRISHEAGKRALETLYHPDGEPSVSNAPPEAAKKVIRYDAQGNEVQ